MSELLAFSFDADASPAIALKQPVDFEGGSSLAYGWGIGWYPGGETAAVVIKDPTSSGNDAMTWVLRDWARFRSTIFLCHLRGTGQRITQRDAQPFIRSHAGRHWVFAHDGDLVADLSAAFPLRSPPLFEPLGRTDSEYAFCWMLEQLFENGYRRLGDVPRETLLEWMRRLNALGAANFLVSDGEELIVYHDLQGRNGLHWIRRTPPHASTRLESSELTVNLGNPEDPLRTMLVFASRPLSGEAWHAMAGGQLLVARRGTLVWNSSGDQGVTSGRALAKAVPSESGTMSALGPPPAERATTPSAVAAPDRVPVSSRVSEGEGTHSRRLRIWHETVYEYTDPVERSSHRLRLRPVQDRRQEVLSHRLDISVDGFRRDFEDVFGNQSTLLEVSKPFSELTVHSRSDVLVRAEDPVHLRSPLRRDTIPLVWMPWQRQMMTAYLLPPELPEAQLRELSDFAMSFVERNEYDLLETILDMNRSLYRDIAYVSGSTTLATTPYEVYATRRGVCQDFANLLICMARLLNVPARYCMGYIFTGATHANRIQSEASHAWAELYLPWIGWHGFDPTNGCQVQLDHVRVACGRNYVDATPTSGTIFKGGGVETLSLRVRVETIDDAPR